MTRFRMMMLALAVAMAFCLTAYHANRATVAYAAEEHDHDHDHNHGDGDTDDHDDAGADDHDEHGDHDHDHGHDDEGGVVRLSPQVMREFGIVVELADGGTISQTIRLPGEVTYNADRVAHVTPTVSGIVRSVHHSVGKRVEAGETMAVLSSRELAAARSAYLAAQSRRKLAEESLAAQEKLFTRQIALAEELLAREERLLKDRVGTEQQVLASRQTLDEVRMSAQLNTLAAKQAVDESRIGFHDAEHALYAMGYSQQQLSEIASLDAASFSAYELKAPIGGVVTQRHLTLGEVVSPDGEDASFIVADLSSVWVNVTVYQRDLAHVHAGESVAIQFGHGIPDATGSIEFVSPAVDETTRTATARIVLSNPNGVWRPGLFVTALIDTGHDKVNVAVARSAVTELDGEEIVFVKTGQGFEPRKVRLGRSSREKVEVLEGLKAGEQYVSRNVLALKAELNRAALEYAGHVH